MRSPAELTDAFRQRGLKITPQRQCIFRLLHDNVEHPTADAVYAAAVAEMPSISLRTVYQTLNDLATMGEINAVDLGTGSGRFEPNVADHHHLVCDVCGAVRCRRHQRLGAACALVRASPSTPPKSSSAVAARVPLICLAPKSPTRRMSDLKGSRRKRI